MARPYGKFPKPSRRRLPASRVKPTAEKLRIRINGRYDLEQLSLLFQRIIAQLQDAGVVSVEDCTTYLVPLDETRERMSITNSGGEVVETITVALPASARFSDACAKD
jgi:hypothetical protein